MERALDDPWRFPEAHSCSISQQSLVYRGLGEIGQGGPLIGVCFWHDAHGQQIELPGSYGGPPIWEPLCYRVALPLWSRGLFEDQQLAILDTQLRKLVVFRRGFRVLQLQSFDGLQITGIDSPIYNPRPVSFDAGVEAIKRVFEL